VTTWDSDADDSLEPEESWVSVILATALLAAIIWGTLVGAGVLWPHP
jgi:hypothetical protein